MKYSVRVLYGDVVV